MKAQKIGIVTWYNYPNPGTAFQAYALQQFINSIPSCEAEVINIMNDFYYTIKSSIIKRYSKEYGLFSKPVLLYLGLQSYKFCSFQRKHIICYPSKPLNRCLQDEDCRIINERYDWVILGSDQLWNFNFTFATHFSEDRFLSFVSSPKKGAYAPSMGKDDWPDEYKNRIKELLSDFSFIGVREKHAVRIVQPLTHIPVHWSLDSTFLLDKSEWAKIAKNPKQEGEYIFEYCILKSPILRAATEKLAAKTGLPVIEHHGDIRKNVPSAKRMPHPNPETWLGYLMNAKYVVTDSFHACAFSINTNRYFYAIVTNNGSRIYSLLELFGLQNHALTETDEIDPKESIDWNTVNQILEERRKDSQDWLRTSLKKD